ncbi:galactose-specific lectin nattectin-like [Festucalex cinctus]
MAFALRSLFLFCGFTGLLTGVWSRTNNREKDNNCVANTCCPKGWTQLGSRCFVFHDDRRQFADAESICNILGGNLASVHSALEYAIILQLVQAASDSTEDVWLGLHEALKDNAFVWTDGSQFDFSAFNNNTSGGDCFELERSDDLWDNDNCSDRNPFVCARRAEQCSH